MKKRVMIYKTGHAFLGKSTVQDGFVGEVDAVFNAVTITLIKPHTDLQSVKRSLEITLQDIELRISQINNTNNK